MFVGWGQLVLYILLFKPLFEFMGALVIELMKAGFASPFRECVVNVCNGLCKVCQRSTFDWSHQYVVAIIIISHHDIIVALAGWVG